MTNCKDQFDELTFTTNGILDEDLEALKRMSERSRIERYNQIKSDEEELQWEFRKECSDFLSDNEQQRVRGEMRLARLLLAASFYSDGEMPTAMEDDFVEAELQAVVDFDQYKQFDALDQDQIEERIRRMEGEVYELVQEYTSSQIANMDELIDNPDVQQDVIERLTERYDERRKNIRQGFFVYVETHGIEHMVESIEDAVQAVAGSKNEREQIQNVLREEISDLESSLESGFQRQRKQIERDLSKVEREVASETVDTEEIKDQLRDIDTVDDSAIEELKNSISRTQQLESKLDDKIEELENAKQTAAEASREEAGQQAAEVVEDELDRLHEQRSDLQAEINRLQMEREEIEEARNRLDERQRSLEERVEDVETSVDKEGGIEGADVVTASTARLFEMDYIGRFDTTMYQIDSLRLPDDNFVLPEDYWDGRSERRNEGSRMSKLLDDNDGGPKESNPINPTARYEITESKYLGLSETTEMVIEATVFSHLKAHAVNGFDAAPANLDDLLSFVNSAVKEASEEDVPYLLGIASPTGWTDRVADLVENDDISRARYSRHVSVCLIDLRSGELFYDDSDSIVVDNINLFERAVQAESVDECVSKVRSEYVSDLGRETVFADEIVDETEYDQHIVKQSFDRLESHGDGEQFYVDEQGLALDIS